MGLIFIVFLLVLTTGGVAAFARARGGNPLIWGSLCIVGYLLIQFGGGFLIGALGYGREENATVAVVVASWAWIGIIAFCARFLVGASKAKPDGMWSCPHCRYLNQHYAVICDACQKPYGTKPQSTQGTNP